MGLTEADKGKVLRQEKCPGTMPECRGRGSTNSTAAQEPARSTLTSSSSTAAPSQGISHAGALSERSGPRASSLAVIPTGQRRKRLGGVGLLAPGHSAVCGVWWGRGFPPVQENEEPLERLQGGQG